MASYDIAYQQYVQPNEGGYANVTSDKGGETYAGISRVNFPFWEGWTIIDIKKNSFVKRIIPHNEKFDDLNFLVDRFFRAMWNDGKFNQINSQEVANLLFDFKVHSGNKAIRTVQEIVGVTPDGAMGPQTITAINTMDPAKLHNTLKQRRKDFLETLIKLDPSQKKFQANWMARVAKFKDLVVGASLWWGLGIAAAIGITIYYLSQEENEKVSETL